MKAYLPYFALAVLVLIVTSCDLDKLSVPPPPTFCETVNVSYEDDIRPIIDNSCAHAGCHIAGAPQGDFRTYDGIKPKLDQGLFQQRVFDFKDDPVMGMPPDFTPTGPQNLTQNELDLLECWINDGYPRN